MRRCAVLVDRDGTIIEDADYARDPERVTILPGAGEALRLLREKGYLLYVVSNQSGVGRGIILERELHAVHRRFDELLRAQGVTLDGYAYCLHRPDEGCDCRKPRTGLVPRLYRNEPIDLAASFTVGDKESDLRLADAVGATGCLVLTGKGVATLEALREKGESRYPAYADLLAFARAVPAVR